jgi:2-dehydro-3-deoxyphosphogluconate aldolase/(4S)-4-hydroxy-2-oxoglutarate aldolase
MKYQELYSKLKTYGVIPVIAIENEEFAIPLADALIEGGLPVAEITFRTLAAADVIARIHSERPEILLGAGTILSLDDLALAKQSGASFGVAPGLNPQIVSEAKRMDFPFIPGVVTPTEIEKALSLENTILKFFPAAASGGLKTIKALSAPYMHVGVKFMPTGGVNIENMSEYLKSEAVLCLGGTWIAPREAIVKGEWKKIRDNCIKAKAMVHNMCF